MNKNDIKITGEWEGLPIWRDKTSAEKLLELIASNEKAKLEQHEK